MHTDRRQDRRGPTGRLQLRQEAALLSGARARARVCVCVAKKLYGYGYYMDMDIMEGV